jgi:hypothetical protein
MPAATTHVEKRYERSKSINRTKLITEQSIILLSIAKYPVYVGYNIIEMSSCGRRTAIETTGSEAIFQSNKRLCVETKEKTFLERITLTPDTHTGLVNHKDFTEIFNQFQIAYIPKVDKLCSISKDRIATSDLSAIFASLDKDDQETWTEETWDSSMQKNGEGVLGRTSGSFLSEVTKNTHQRGYCSFIVQHDTKALENMLSRLPISELPLAAAVTKEADDGNDDIAGEPNIQHIEYGPGLWIFFGRNCNTSDDLQGRGEHTDSIDHHGTFHYQWSGIKDWHFRPTEELLRNMINADTHADPIIENWRELYEEREKDDCTKEHLDIRCEEGDILLVNTRLWWHSTTLPTQPKSKTDADEIPSVSYARDIYLDGNTNESKDRQGSNLTNLDGLYAAHDIDSGTIVFKETEMPDCELHRTAENPNCEIVELEDGEGAIVSCRDIRSGEFFCILDSEDEESDLEIDSEVDEEN